MLSKSQSRADCSACPLYVRGAGYVPPAGPRESAEVLLLAESPGVREAEQGIPLVGPAGGETSRLLYRLSHSQDEFLRHNVVSCRPPADKLEKMPWQNAIDHCQLNLDWALSAPNLKVIVTLGGVPTRSLLRTGGNLKDFHGTVTEVAAPTPGNPDRKLFVVPTFHPAHLIRGAHNLTGTVLFDLNRAFEVAKAGWQADTPTLHLDPPPAFVDAWITRYLAALAQDPLRTWLSIDIETADKERKLDEGELKSTDRSMEITRVNLAWRTDEGLTFPLVGPYIPALKRALLAEGAKWFWNKNYDLKRLWAFYGVETLRGALLDGMDAWHVLHSDVPKGLGFVSPFYSKLGAWKHLSSSKPAYYAACDAVQNQRDCFGVAKDLVAMGMWNAFWRHMHEVDRVALQPSCRVGLKLNPLKLEEMRVDLSTKTRAIFDEMQALVPEDLKPLHPKDGWAEAPTVDGEGGSYVYPKPDDPKRGWRSRPRPVLEKLCDWTTKFCETCQEPRVTVKHRCKGVDGRPVKGANPAIVVEKTLLLPRYHVREDFNPGSPQQVMAYIKFCKHKPGHEHGKETTNREAIERLADAKPKSKRDEVARELYHGILDFREVKKVLGNYVEGMLRRLAESGDGRVHPVVTNNPSTMRTAYNSPNLQNVVADKRGKASLASGFRKCIEAEEEAPNGQAS